MRLLLLRGRTGLPLAAERQPRARPLRKVQGNFDGGRPRAPLRKFQIHVLRVLVAEKIN